MGNALLRKLLYMCTWTAQTCNKTCKALAERLEAKDKLSKIIKVAIAHKLMEQGQGKPYALRYATLFCEQRARHKDQYWAHAYAEWMAKTKPERNASKINKAFATAFANHYASQREGKAGQSQDWAWMYAWQCTKNGLDHKQAADAAHSYSSQIVGAYSPAFAKTYAETKAAQLKAGKANNWAHEYASKIAESKYPGQAREFANHQHPGG